MAQYIPCQACSRTVNRFLEVCPYCGSDPGGDRTDHALPASTEPITSAPSTEYRPIESIAVFVQLLFGLLILGSLVSAVTGWTYRTVLLDLDAGRSVVMTDAILVEDRYLVAAGVVAVANVVLAGVFVLWFWRAYSNLAALGRPRKRRAGWAIGGWFLPFANLVIPYGIGAEIWKESWAEPLGGYSEDATNLEPVISWWALFVIMGLVNQIAFFSSGDLADDPGRVAANVGIDLVGRLVAIAGAVAAIRYVRGATTRQAASARSAGLESSTR